MKIDPAAVVSTASTPTGSVGASSASPAEADTVEGLTARLLLLQAKTANSGGPPPPPPPPPLPGMTKVGARGSVRQEVLVLASPRGQQRKASSPSASAACPAEEDPFDASDDRKRNYVPSIDKPAGAGNPAQCKDCKRWTRQWRFMLQILVLVGQYTEFQGDPEQEPFILQQQQQQQKQ